jgi:hypothetical protein
MEAEEPPKKRVKQNVVMSVILCSSLWWTLYGVWNNTYYKDLQLWQKNILVNKNWNYLFFFGRNKQKWLVDPI